MSLDESVSTPVLTPPAPAVVPAPWFPSPQSWSLKRQRGTWLGRVSLADRMASRRLQLEKTTAAAFAVPGWDQEFCVRLGLLPYKDMRKITERHEKLRNPALAEVYSMADQIITATEGFYDLQDFGGDLPTPDDDGNWPEVMRDVNWLWLCRVTYGSLAQGLNTRQAFLKLVGDGSPLVNFYREWNEWASTRRPEIDKQVAGDFRETT